MSSGKKGEAAHVEAAAPAAANKPAAGGKAAPSKPSGKFASTKNEEGQPQHRPRNNNNNNYDGPKGNRENRDSNSKGQHSRPNHSNASPKPPQETGPFARVSNMAKNTALTTATTQMSYADMVREKSKPKGEPSKEKPVEEKPKPAEKAAAPAAATKEEVAPAAAPVVEEKLPAPTPVQETPAPAPAPVKREVPPTPTPTPTPPKPEPAASYYVLEIDRVESVKLPSGFTDGSARDQVTFSATPGVPPPPPPPPPAAPVPTPTAHPAVAPAAPAVQQPHHHMYQEQILPQRNFAFNAFPASSMPPNLYSAPQPETWGDRRFPNANSLQYSSHSPNPNLNRPQYMRVSRADFSDPRNMRQNTAGSVW